MITTIYTCDRCSKNVGNSGDLLKIKIVSERFGAEFHKVDWCMPCMKEVGMVVPVEKKREVSYVAPSFEDMLREIIRTEITDVTGAC